jgi:hypothetical protein
MIAAGSAGACSLQLPIEAVVSQAQRLVMRRRKRLSEPTIP